MEQTSSFIDLPLFYHEMPNTDVSFDASIAPVGLDCSKSRWHLACRWPGEGAVAVFILNMEMKITLTYFTKVHKSQICPLPRGLSCRLCVVLYVPVFIYPFWNYFHCSDIFPGLLDLTIRAYFNFG